HCGDDREVFRIEGDKFAIIPDYAPEENECNVRMQQLVDKIEDFNFRYRDIEFHVNCSAVCVRQPVPNLFAAAEMALDDIRQNKLKYRCNHDFDNMFHRSELNIASYEMLRRAIDRSELQAYYQPIMALENREIVKYEVLARVVNGDGVHSPGGFMEAAKSSRLYHRLTETILRQSLESYASHGKHFSINLSILDIDHDPTRYMLRHLATEYPDAIKKMTIEITEEEGVENFSEVENFCHEMHDLGVSIAIDDFGKGYSNFDVIARLPIDIIKFDGQLVQNIGTSSKYDLLIAKVCEYAKGNDIRTIAEFVDSEKLLEHIVELGVDYAQGYHISEPLPLQNLDAFGTKKE
ncbi:MAG: EAL domain-containing protein, partial [Sulfurimonadaceae bacterium]|nr:EAL domain-containing protein [Sulfurimonadaceae bacterium]